MKKELNKTAEKSCPSVGINWYPRSHVKNQKTNNRRYKTN